MNRSKQSNVSSAQGLMGKGSSMLVGVVENLSLFIWPKWAAL